MSTDQIPLDEPVRPAYPATPIADPRQAKPLLKLMNRMLRPPRKPKTRNWKKKINYY